MVRALWREGNFDSWTESAILRDFGVVLLKSDHKYRADRLLYAESYAAAFRAAALAGSDEMALAQARAAAARGPLGPALLKAVPGSLKNDPGLLFARIQDARRANRAYEAATLLESRADRPRLSDQSGQVVVRAADGRARASRSRTSPSSPSSSATRPRFPTNP